MNSNDPGNTTSPDFAQRIVSSRKLIFTFTAALALFGLIAYATMPKEEDPRLQERNGLVTIIYPGATPKEIERLIVEPVEDELSELADVRKIESTMRSQAAIVTVQLRDSVSGENAVNEAWRDVRDALDRAALEFPDGVLPYELNRNLLDLEAIVLGITGSDDPLVLLDEARRLKNRLLGLSLVSGVNIVADPGEQISIDIDDERMRALGLNYDAVAAQLVQSNTALPAGSVRMGDRTVNVLTNSSFASIEEIRGFPIILNSGDVVTLGEIAGVRRSPALPLREAMFVDGEAAVGLGIMPRQDINLMDFGDDVRAVLAEFAAELQQRRPEVRVDEVNFQPDYVERRLAGLSFSLLSGIAIVACVVLIAMGLRIGVLTASLVPVISLIALGVYAAGGGVLHQISVAAFVLALGLLIDNVIVIVEGVQEKIDAGEEVQAAAARTIREFALPLATATGTTVAAFLPMFGASGNTADFTRAIPLIAMLTLSVSYLFSIFVTPSIAVYTLRPGTARAWNFTDSIGAFVGEAVFRRPGLVLLFVLGVVACAGASFGFVQKKFFPAADRNQLVVDLRLPEGTHFRTTRDFAQRLDSALREEVAVTHTAVFVGRSTPQFYYNLIRSPRSPHVAQMIVRIEDFEQAGDVRRRILELARAVVPEATLVVRELQQGPPTKAPVEIRLTGDDHGRLGEGAARIIKLLREIPGTATVRGDYGLGLPHLKFTVGDANSLRYGIARSSVSAVLLGRTRGLPAGDLRAEGFADPLPILIRAREGEELSFEQLRTAFVGQTRTGSLSVEDLSTHRLEWQPAVLHHVDRKLVVSVFAETADGFTASEVLAGFEARRDKLELPAGVALEFGGEQAESGDANTAIAAALPAGAALLLISLLIEFRSFRKVAIILITIPLAMAGVAPGLLLSGNPFGFLSLLGSLALVGIVVNNAILLIDAVDHRLAAGDDLRAALQYAVGRRLRPILLTTLTTITGLLPLAFTSASLWPPFAWAIISGLGFATLLTLLAVPAMYRLIFGRGTLWNANAGMVLIVVGMMLVMPPALRAEDAEQNSVPPDTEQMRADLAAAIESAKGSAAVAGSYADARAAGERAKTLSRATYFPKVGAGVSYEVRDRELRVPAPLGLDFGGARSSFAVGSVEVVQPIFDPANMLFNVPAAEQAAEAARLNAKHVRRQSMAEGAFRYLDALRLEVRRRNLSEFQRTLSRRRAEIRRLYEFGRVAEADLLRVDLALDDTRLGLTELNERLPVAYLALGRAMGLDREVRPEPLGAPAGLRETSPEFASSYERALADRTDLVALAAQIRAKELELRGVDYEILPRLFVRGAWTYQSSGQFTDNNWFSISAGMTMPIFDGGTRSTRSAALAAELDSLQARRRDAERGIGIEVRDAIAILNTRRQELILRESGLARARRTVNIESVRYRQGKSSLNDLLDAEVILRERGEENDLASIELTDAWIRFQLATGADPSPP